jgi:prepilin-type N-terminal cleavage/methylation domain-containing protein
MKNTTKELPVANFRLPVERQNGLFFPTSIVNRKSQIVNRRGFTLIELLVVIAIMAVLAALTFGILGGVHKTASIGAASAELGQLNNALDNYKAKYGSYPPSNPNASPLVNTLYYELSGVTVNSANSADPKYTTLDGACTIDQTSYQNAFRAGAPSTTIDGIINCTKGSVEEGTAAQNFLLGLKANRLGTSSTTGPFITNLITSVRGPDDKYAPLGTTDVNPFRYLYPGTNNPSSYDLWVQLKISGKMYLICNWSKNPIINSPLP